MRPTRGYSFVSSSHVGGLAPDNRSVRFVRQVSAHFSFGFLLTCAFSCQLEAAELDSIL